MTSKVRSESISIALLLVAVLVGCEGRPRVNPQEKLQTAETAADVFIEQAMETLHQVYEYDPEQARNRVIELLNRWLGRTNLQTDWQPDLLVDRLPRRWVDRFRPLRELGTSRFVADDALYLQACVWARGLANFAGQADGRRDASLARYIDQARLTLTDEQLARFNTQDDQLAEAMRHLHRMLDADGARDLAAVLRVFDWSVRNIQLDELLSYPQSTGATAAVAETTDDAQEELRRLFPQFFQPGPGYQQLPHEILLHGHGDAWERARAFILIARQMGIDVVMLALQNAEATTRPQEWLPAALIQGELFLFDTQLGIPIPGPGGRGIATLAQVLQHPELLRSLDLQEDDKTLSYRITEYDLEAIAGDKTLIIALVDAPVAALSQRIELLEDNLTAADKLVLAVRPSRALRGGEASLEDRLLHSSGIGQVRIWTTPFEAAIYVGNLQAQGRRDEASWNEHGQERRMFSVASSLLFIRQSGRLLMDPNPKPIFPLREGRIKHFRGALTGGEGSADRGALSLYREARQPRIFVKEAESNKTMEIAMTPSTVKNDRDVQQMLGLLDEHGEPMPERVKEAEQLLMRTRSTAGYWMALAHFDSGNDASYSTSANWLELQMESGEVGTWGDGCRYNLARAYEVLGKTEQARELYGTGDSPQRHGNLLRARSLEATAVQPPSS